MIDFKGSHFERDVVLWGVRWYVAYPMSYRQLEEMMEERGVDVDHSTLNHWVVKYAPLLEKRFRAGKRPVGSSWRLDETYVKVKGSWKYLYRAVDKAGATVDFLLTAKRDYKAALLFLRKAIGQRGEPQKITIDKSGANTAAIERYKAEHEADIEIRRIKYLNNIVEQDHRAVKRVTRPMLGFESFRSAAATLSVQPYPWLSFYGNYTKSFGLNNGVTRAGAALGPQTAIQMEGGVKAELLDKRLSVTLAYYDIKKYNIARNTPGLAGALRGFVYDLLDAESKGVEIDVTGRIDDNWSVIANFLHMNTHVTKGSTLPASDPFDIVTQAPVAGKRLPAVPENMGNLWVKYDADGAFRGWSGAIGASRVGTAWVDPANSFIAPAYTLLRAMASYRFALGPTHVTAQVNVDNLLNSTYI